MFSKCIVFAVIALVAVAQAGVLPAAYVAPYASSYNAHTVNHAIASPIVQSAPLVTAPAVVSSPLVASAPYVAAPYSAYSAFPYSAYPYVI
ncbi:hypothetical protein Bhyg_06856 [Pseudolycoriella hygida]|uniref:Uncharacterized protein n=1 Tax=Pseudolycoriella hygida TaxID=35572 RepID=A0A9Q0N245_9DIPT|nr:hypothetical protein Bhyg_06856 [Pseudolycoriella hygida]